MAKIKIGILTYHYAPNEGAVLQAKYMAELLQAGLPEMDVEIIDMRYPCRLNALKNLKSSRLLLDYVRKNLPLSAASFENEEHAIRYINENYAGVVLGSDEIWRLNGIKSRLRCIFFHAESKLPPPFPNLYWSDKRIRSPQFSFSADIGPENRQKILFFEKEKMKRRLKNLRLIGVRSNAAKEFLGRLSQDIADRAIITPDPVFFSQPDSQASMSAKIKLEAAGIDFSRPRIAFFLYDKNSLALRACLQHCRTNNYQIIASFSLPGVDIDLSGVNLNPDEWLWAFCHYSGVVTDRMHASIGCLLNNTPFLGLLGPRGALEYKIKELMSDFEMSEYYFRNHELKPQEIVELLEKRLNQPLDQVKVQAEIERRRGRLRKFSKEIQKYLFSE